MEAVIQKVVSVTLTQSEHKAITRQKYLMLTPILFDNNEINAINRLVNSLKEGSNLIPIHYVEKFNRYIEFPNDSAKMYPDFFNFSSLMFNVI